MKCTFTLNFSTLTTVIYNICQQHTGNVLEDPRNASGGCFINGCSLIPPLFAGENPAGASNGGGGGELEELRHISHSSEKKTTSM